jgi:hypothetical protein
LTGEEGGQPLRVICAWCGDHISGETGNVANLVVSHGICAQCKEKLFDDDPDDRDTVANL